VARSEQPRVWLVTGASSGFGRAIATAALDGGDTVVAIARRPQALDDLIAAYPGQAQAIALDVTQMNATQVIDDVIARHGRIDVLVNNAGRTQVGALEETTEQELRYLTDHPPLRLPLGGDAVDGIRAHLAAVGDEVTVWEPVSRATSFDPG
jgi:NADP-dependent 3-hydroxy acid dehydrogenase YdfG